MLDPAPTLYFDFVDPLSHLLEREIAELGEAVSGSVQRLPFELRPPPTPLVTVDDPSLVGRWEEARAIATGGPLPLAPPRLVPWSRKAHELHLFAATHAVQEPVRDAIYSAYHTEGRDIGRVDVLVEIARAFGLAATETKAVLDVDRFDAEVVACRRSATAAGITDAPTLVVGPERLRGFHKRATLSTFLRPS